MMTSTEPTDWTNSNLDRTLPSFYDLPAEGFDYQAVTRKIDKCSINLETPKALGPLFPTVFYIFPDSTAHGPTTRQAIFVRRQTFSGSSTSTVRIDRAFLDSLEPPRTPLSF